MSESDGKTLVVIPGSEVDAPPPDGPLCGSERLHRIVLHLRPILDRTGITLAQQGNLFGHVVGLLVDAYRAGAEEGEEGALVKLRQTTHARLAESGALELARADGHRAGIVHALTRVEAEADGYRRRAQATRVEAEVAEAKADALTGAVAAIRREVAP